MSDAATTALRSDRSAAARLLASSAAGNRRRRPTERSDVVVPIDARTRYGKVAATLRRELLAQLGPNPTPAQLAVIAQLVQLKIRICVMDAAFSADGQMSLHDSRTYLSWANAFVRGLRTLGLRTGEAPAAETAPSLADALATGARVAANGAAAPARAANGAAAPATANGADTPSTATGGAALP